MTEMTDETVEETAETPVEQQVQRDAAQVAHREPPASPASPAEPETVQETEPETFPADVVHKLRDEAARYRTRAKDRDDLAQQLFTAKVAATGRLADPTDLPYDEGLLNDSAALDEAVEELIHAKPHLASRRPTGSVGQGPRSGDAGAVDLASMLRARAS